MSDLTPELRAEIVQHLSNMTSREGMIICSTVRPRSMKNTCFQAIATGHTSALGR